MVAPDALALAKTRGVVKTAEKRKTIPAIVTIYRRIPYLLSCLIFVIIAVSP
jgi:hypothetical protein